MIKRVLLVALILLFIGLPIRAEAITIVTKEDVLRTVRDSFTAHDEQFTINMSAKTLTELGTDADLLAAAVSIDDPGTPKDGEYLKVTVISWNERWEYNKLGKASISVSAKYRTTRSQEKQLEDKIAEVLDALQLENASDYEKVKAIHDFIINQVTYDQSLQKYTAYDALIGKSAVCQGYAAAAYRMFTSAGIESIIVSGTAGGGPHVWNIVKVDGKWYNIDLTWDDSVTALGNPVISYDYFLKNEEAFSDHERDFEYTTKEFLNAYPIADKSY